MRFVIIGLLVSLSISSHAQADNLFASAHSSFRLVFKFSAKALYNKKGEFNYPDLTQFKPIDTLRLNRPLAPYIDSLPDGHYITAFAWHEDVHMEYHQLCPYTLSRLKDGQNTRLLVYNAVGQLDKSITLRFGKRKVDYSEEQASFYLRKNTQSAVYTIENGTDTFYFNSHFLHSSYRNQKMSKSPAVIKGIRQAWNQSFARPKLHGWGRLKGYMATNKPTYRIGDTVRLKAYVLKRNGKPYHKPLNLQLYTYYGGKQYIDMPIQPTKPGVYEYSFVVADSFVIDKEYKIGFKTNRSRIWVRNSFWIEDYQLDEAKINVSSSQYQYYLNDTVKTEISAFDANGLSLRDATADIVVSHLEGYSMKTGCETIPKTLLETSIQLDNDGKTDFIIPDSLLSKNLAQSIEIKYNINTASTETHEKSIRLRFNPIASPKSKESVSIIDNNTHIQIENAEAGDVVEWLKNMDVLKTETYANENLTIPALASDVRIISKGDTTSAVLAKWQSKVFLGHTRTADSVSFSCLNARKLDIHYQLYKGEWLQESGVVSANKRWRFEANNKLPYSLRVEYVWAGISMSSTEYAFLKENELTIEVNQPAKIFPGQEQKIEVSVSDYKEESIADADVLAYGINSTFEKENLPSLPIFRTKRNRIRLKEQSYVSLNTNWKRTKHLSQKDVALFELDSHQYYQLIRSKKAVINYQHDSVSITQFTPHVFKNTYAQGIIMVYVDGVIVYWNQSSPSLAIPIEPGKHDITIRLRKSEFTLNDLVFEKGKKHELCVNMDILGKAAIKRRNSMTRSERKSFEKSLLQLDYRKQTIFEQDGLKYSKEYNYSSRSWYVGPFKPNDTVSYRISDGTSGTIITGKSNTVSFGYNGRYYTRHIYSFGDERRFRKQRLSRESANAHPQNFYQFFNNHVDFPNTKYQGSKIKESFEYGSGKLVLFYGNRDLLSKKICNNAGKCSNYKNSDLSYGANVFEKLDPGVYSVELIFREGTFLVENIEIKEESVSYVDLDQNCELIQQSFSSSLTGISIKGQLIDIQSGTILEKTPASQAYLYSINSENPALASINTKGFQFIQVPTRQYFLGQRLPSEMLAYTHVSSQSKFELGNVYIIYRTVSVGNMNVNTHRYMPTRNLSYSMSQVGRVSGLYGDTPSIRGSRDKNAIDDGYGGASSLALSLPDSNRSHTFLGGADYNKQAWSDLQGSLLKYDVNSYNQGALMDSVSGYQSSMRSNFTDAAFWFPSLSTNQNGQASFTAKFPDDITNWETHYLVIGDKKSGAYHGDIKSYLPLSANLRGPRFLIEGDETELIAQDLNYTGDSLKVIPSFQVNSSPNEMEPYFLQESKKHRQKIKAIGDTMHLEYRLETEYDFYDGEKRDIPVFKKGIEQKEGHFMVLKKDSTLSLTFNPQLGPISLYAALDPVEELLKSVEDLRDYAHACNEQIASKLMALFFEETLKNKEGQSSFNSLRIKKLINKLEKNYQPKKQGWSWFNDNGSYSPWVSNYVIQTLLIAKERGYESSILPSALAQIDSYYKNARNKGTQCEWLYLLSQAGVDFNYTSAINELSQTKLSDYHQVMLARIKQQQQYQFNIEAFLATKKETATGMLYWGSENAAFYHSALPTTVLAFDILKEAGKTAELEKVALWLLYQRRNGAWDNTMFTAKALMRIIPHYQFSKKNLKEKSKVQYQKPNGEWKSLEGKITLPFSQVLQIRKVGATPLFFTAYQTFWNPTPEPKTKIARFTLEFANQDSAFKTLVAGKPVQLKVKVNVQQAAEYCMVSIPIPAGCSYGEKTFNHYWRSNEVHREYHKDRVVIYYENLPVGTYDVAINLEPRFRGNYHLNPTQLELMYFPTLSANNGASRVVIE